MRRVVLLVCCVVLAVTLVTPRLCSPPLEADTTAPAARAVKPFRLDDATGKPWALADAGGKKAVVVLFLGTECPINNQYLPALAKLSKAYAEKGVPFVGINSNDSTRYPEDAPDQMAEHARQWGWAFPYVVDGEQSAALAYRAACTPDFFLFDGERRLVYRGRLDGATPGNDVPVTGDELDAAVSAMLAGEAVSTDQRPSVGCSIKWKPGSEPGW